MITVPEEAVDQATAILTATGSKIQKRDVRRALTAATPAIIDHYTKPILSAMSSDTPISQPARQHRLAREFPPLWMSLLRLTRMRSNLNPH